MRETCWRRNILQPAYMHYYYSMPFYSDLTTWLLIEADILKRRSDCEKRGKPKEREREEAMTPMLREKPLSFSVAMFYWRRNVFYWEIFLWKSQREADLCSVTIENYSREAYILILTQCVWRRECLPLAMHVQRSLLSLKSFWYSSF